MLWNILCIHCIYCIYTENVAEIFTCYDFSFADTYEPIPQHIKN